MKVLVVGGGGREHALCWRLARSPQLTRLYCAPGNPGTAGCATNVALAADDLTGLADFAAREAIDLTVVGPEVPLCEGLQAVFAARGLLVFGPSPAGARLEGSKVFAKQIMAQCGLRTAPFAVCERLAEATAYIGAHPGARVVKADGLAAGKGVVVAADAAQACRAARDFLEGEVLGPAGRRIVIEERLRGEEVSVLALCDGERVLTLPSCQDHKAVLDGDEGPNTGGMGAYSPAPVLGPELQRRVEEEILLPVVRGLAAQGTPYRGVLYAGLMIVAGEPYVLEFNCRFGDPETQPLMLRCSADLLPYLYGAARGELPRQPLQWDDRAALCVVLTAAGYPGPYRKGQPITGLEQAEALADVAVFHGGTAHDADGRLVTAGGRVLGVTALGEDVAAAQQRAYAAVRAIAWEGLHYRRDIGHRAVGRR
ncbi:MAG: phosphoribosylamine--glycine ligase [Proteobacteria bacterium]|nr:phosphoribosylamine--glycine ligase [Pseudomonadota bacterium]